ncbi:MAG: hypothetical protein Q9159_007666, partial [Coniocarpon cinnabarinum]
VRAVAFASSSTIISASRDATVRAWHLKSPQPPAFDDTIVAHGQAFINSVAYLPPSSEFPEPLVASGGKDCIIDVRQLGQKPDADAERLLLGHQGNICALDVYTDSKQPYLVSGSWDGSAMVWNVAKGESTATLEGHSGNVWDVLAFDDSKIITGPACADHSIRVFSTNGELLHTIGGGGEIVRALCKLPSNHASGAQFASAGNDSVIRLWTIDGREVAQLHGHENFIYSLATLPSGEIVSSGEDRTVRIWQDSQCIQTITHPAISVWTVAVNPENGDIVSGASDRIVRIFSRSADRQGDQQAIQSFEESVQESSIPKQAMGDINKEQLPGPDFLQKKSGVKEGQVQMIREANGNVSAHQWSHLAQQWVNVGTVVDAAGSSGRKNQHMGKDYDYVFDVDIEDGKPPLKLPYNLSQNPYEVAKKFIADNELPLSYLDQVADFIVKNTQGATMGQSIYSSAPAPENRPKVLPQQNYLSITTANFSIISRKIQELNSQLLNDGRKDLSLSPDEQQSFPRMVTTLESALSKTLSASDIQLLDSGSDLVVKIVRTWPMENRIPGFDLFRCLTAAYPGLAKRHDILGLLSDSGVLHAGNANLTMLAMRAIANLFTTSAGREYISSNVEGFHGVLAPHIQPTAGAVNRNVLIAVTTCYVNFAVMLSKGEQGSIDAGTLARTLLKDLSILLNNSKVQDSESIYRALVAVGTLVKVPGARDEAAGDVDAAVRSASGRCKEPRVKGVVEEMTA